MHPRTPPNRWTPTLLAAALALGASLPAGAARPTASPPASGDKKLYCWDDGGRRICSDALPPSAVGRPRTEVDQRTGTTLKRVGRELTSDERARAALDEEAVRIEEQRKRRETAMVVSYATEEDLKRAFRERFDLIEESLKGSELALVNLHSSLISLLRQANELEMQSRPVGKRLREKIIAQHGELRTLRGMKQRQLAEREAVGSEFQAALTRYRALKFVVAPSLRDARPAPPPASPAGG